MESEDVQSELWEFGRGQGIQEDITYKINWA